MSIINDALKKAQKQRTGEAPPLAARPGVGGEPAARIVHHHRRQPTSSGIPYMQIGVGAGIALFLIVGSVLLGRFLMNRPSEPAPAKPAVVANAAPKPETPPKSAPGTPTAFVLPIAAPSAGSAPIAPAATSVAVQPVPKAPPAPPPPEPEPVKPALKLEGRAINFIESLRVAGIRASATDSKVLMNDRVYRVGNIVEHEMGLKLTGITADSLTFEDERGASYTRNF